MNGLVETLQGDRFAARILRRDLVRLPREQLYPIVSGKVVVVTGAGGYIGSALVRLLAEFAPARIVLADNGEHALYQIDREMRGNTSSPPFDTVICDVRDPAALDHLFKRFRPELVFHAAALKHLPLTEANPREAVLTNALGTANLIEACRSAGTAAMVHISTDKAAAPTSVLGKTKRVAELICQAADNRAATRCVSVRFNNVFGSSGSVVPLFLEQIAQGQALTITDPRMNRHFVTASEATQLIIAALGLSLVAEGAEGPVYFLETGPAIAITELARRILAEAGRQGQLELVTVGMRTGEKLDEQLIAPWEVRRSTGSPLIGRADDGRAGTADVRRLVEDLRHACRDFDEARLGSLLDLATTEPAASDNRVPAVGAA